MLWLKKIKQLDIFELGVSSALYYTAIYGVLPLMVVLFTDAPWKISNYFIGAHTTLPTGQTLGYVLVGLVSLIAGYTWYQSDTRIKKIAEFLNKEWHPQNVFVVWCVVWGLGIAAKIVRVGGGGYFHLDKNPLFTGSSIYSLIGLIDWFGAIAVAIAFIHYFHIRRTSGVYAQWQRIAWGALIFEIVFWFASGSRFSTILPIMVYLIVAHYAYAPSNKRIIIAGLVILFVVMPGVSLYKDPGVLARSYRGESKEIKIADIQRFAIDSSIGRIDQSRIVNALFVKTDEYLHGKSLVNFFVSLGPPRMIWPEKPVISGNGNELGRALGILAPGDFNTNIGPSVIGEWYLNFGPPGILIGMFLMGILFRILYEGSIGATQARFSGVYIYAIIWIHVIKGMEDWMAPVYAGLVKIVIIMLMIHWALTYKKGIAVFLKNRLHTS